MFDVIMDTAREGGATATVEVIPENNLGFSRGTVNANGLTLSVFALFGDTEVAPLINGKLPDWIVDPVSLVDVDEVAAFLSAWLSAAPKGAEASWDAAVAALNN